MIIKHWFIKLLLVALVLMLLNSCGDNSKQQDSRFKNGEGVVRYGISIQGKWSASAPPNAPAFPPSGHFTTFALIVHSNNAIFWNSKMTASAGLENLAELGSTSLFLQEAKNAGSAVLSAKDFSGGNGLGVFNTTVDVSTDHPLITFASMLGPSPDWFVGVHDLSMYDSSTNKWYSRITCDLKGYDAGTEEGIRFTLKNTETNPKENIHLLENDQPLIGAGHSIQTEFATVTFRYQGVISGEIETNSLEFSCN